MKRFLMVVLFFAGCTGLMTMASDRLAEIKATGRVPIKLYVFDSGRIRCNDLSTINPGLEKGGALDMANQIYLIVHPKGSLIWDAGISDEVARHPNGLDVYKGIWIYTVPKTLKSQWAKMAITPESVTWLAFSHLHNDHTGNAGYFKNARLLLQKEARALAFKEGAEQYGYHPPDYMPFKEKVVEIDGIHDVFGDGSVVMIPAPGHSAGHQVLFLDLPKTGPILLSGDLYIFKDQRENFWIPTYNHKKQTLYAYTDIERLVERTGAQVWIQHDLEQFKATRLAPAFYE